MHEVSDVNQSEKVAAANLQSSSYTRSGHLAMALLFYKQCVIGRRYNRFPRWVFSCNKGLATP